MRLGFNGALCHLLSMSLDVMSLGISVPLSPFKVGAAHPSLTSPMRGLRCAKDVPGEGTGRARGRWHYRGAPSR